MQYFQDEALPLGPSPFQDLLSSFIFFWELLT